MAVDLERRAHDAYLEGANPPDWDWDVLPEWIREAWRCEVDGTRDSSGLVWDALAWATHLPDEAALDTPLGALQRAQTFRNVVAIFEQIRDASQSEI